MNTRQEAEQKGIPLAETKQNMLRRCMRHDYSRRGTYLITIVVANRQPLLGNLICDDKPRIILSTLGKHIFDEEIKKIHQHYPAIEMWKTCIMPDHIHMILRINGTLPDNAHLGVVIRGFKAGCTKAYRALTGNDGSLFEEGYNDRILTEDGQLDRWKKYISDNPRRLALKRRNPDLFKVRHKTRILNRDCDVIGNIFLMDIPDKMAVIVHRSDSDKEFAIKTEQWLACGARGGVLVSAAISPREKIVLREAMNRKYPIILLRENGFPPLYKPSGDAFDACAQGLLLQISPWPYHSARKPITRAQCLFLNQMAEEIAESGEPRR